MADPEQAAIDAEWIAALPCRQCDDPRAEPIRFTIDQTGAPVPLSQRSVNGLPLTCCRIKRVGTIVIERA
jgi:hypothetical protein